MNTQLIKTNTQLPYVSTTDETGEAIKSAIRGLESETGFLTRFRLQRTKGKEALALAEVALAIMNDRKITCLFVKEAPTQGLPALGILHIHDLLRAGVV